MEGVVQGVTEAVRSWVRDLGALGIFLGVMVESIVALVPSPLVPMVAGFSLIPSGSDLLSALLQSMVVIGVTGSLAATLGALIHYWIGIYGGKAIIERYGKYLGVKEGDLEKLSSRLSGKGSLSLLMLRIVPIFPLSVVSVGAGILGMELIPYTLLTLFGCFLRYSILGILGFLLGEAYDAASSWLDSIENLIVIVVIIILLYATLRRGLTSRSTGS